MGRGNQTLSQILRFRLEAQIFEKIIRRSCQLHSLRICLRERLHVIIQTVGYDVFTGISKDPFMEEKMLRGQGKKPNSWNTNRVIKSTKCSFSNIENVLDPKTDSAKGESFMYCLLNQIIQSKEFFKFIMKSSVGYNCFQL